MQRDSSLDKLLEEENVFAVNIVCLKCAREGIMLHGVGSGSFAGPGFRKSGRVLCVAATAN